MTDRGFLAMLNGFSLTTAEILYRMPDYPELLQTFIWQDYDRAPHFPKLLDFLGFWSLNLDGKLHRVRIAHSKLIRPHEFHVIDGKFVLH